MAATILEIKKGDTYPALETQLFQTIEGVTTPINFAPSSAKADKPAAFKEIQLRMASPSGTVKMKGECELVKASGDTAAGESGHVKYVWPKDIGSKKAELEAEGSTQKANTITAQVTVGIWKLEWLIVWATGEVQSVPNEAPDELNIAATI